MPTKLLLTNYIKITTLDYYSKMYSKQLSFVGVLYLPYVHISSNLRQFV